MADLLTGVPRRRLHCRSRAPVDLEARAVLVAQLLLFLSLSGSPEAAVRWFSLRNPALQGQTPLSLLGEGAARVGPRLTEVVIADVTTR